VLVVADASVLVAELLRERGRALIADPRLRIVVAEDQWSETRHELGRRVALLVKHARLIEDQASRIQRAIESLIERRVIDVIPRIVYQHMEETARRRVPRDPDDWPPVALALSMNAGILTGDNDFLGCGCPTWTVDTLRDELGQR
jgi:predicted nucleic acid-binding protein